MFGVKNIMKKTFFIILLSLSFNIFSYQDINSYLENAKISQGVKDLSIALQANPNNDKLRFQLGMLQFFQAVENLEQAWYNYGLSSDLKNNFFPIPFLRLPVPNNPNPQKISYQEFIIIFENIYKDLMLAEQTLAAIKDNNVSLAIYFGKVYFDIDQDNTRSNQESLSYIYQDITRANFTQEQAKSFQIHLDIGDIYWLRAYMHLLSGLVEFFLIYDHEKLFDHTAHLFFTDAVNINDFYYIEIIAFIHLLNLPVTQAEKGVIALEHFKTTVQLSKTAWDFYLQETDDNYEWIPNPNQTGVIPGITITQAMVESWLAVLEETALLLHGEKLAPFWRGYKGLGINLSKIFTNPQPFDLVLWIQGPGMHAFIEQVSYKEKDKITKVEFWENINRVFNGRLMGFALWFN